MCSVFFLLLYYLNVCAWFCGIMRVLCVFSELNVIKGLETSVFYLKSQEILQSRLKIICKSIATLLREVAFKVFQLLHKTEHVPISLMTCH